MKTHHTLASEVGEFLRTQRLKAGLSRAEAARRLGLSSTQPISIWERGIRTPSLSNLKQLLKIYQIEPNEFVEIYLSGLEKTLRRLLR